MKMTVFWDVSPCSLVETYQRFRCVYRFHHRPETSVNSYENTQRNIPEVSHLHTRFRDNLKSQLVNLYGEATLLLFGDSKPLIALMMEAVSTSETSVNFYKTTWCNIPEDSHLQITDTSDRNFVDSSKKIP
jgi:hypothetical protein